jgi:hypothetical protein
MALIIAHIRSRNIEAESQPADAGGRIKPGVERGSAEPQELSASKHASPRTRATAIEEELWPSRSQTWFTTLFSPRKTANR